MSDKVGIHLKDNQVPVAQIFVNFYLTDDSKFTCTNPNCGTVLSDEFVVGRGMQDVELFYCRYCMQQYIVYPHQVDYVVEPDDD